jgi:hypothetical protein
MGYAVTPWGVIARGVAGSVLPLIGLGVAVIVNAAWIGFLGYWIFNLV